MSREYDEAPDPRHRRPSSTPLLLLGLLGAFAVVLLAAGVGYVLLRTRTRGQEVAVRAEEDAARAERQAVRPASAPAGDAPADATARAGVNEPVTLDGLTVRVVSVGVGKARVYAADHTMLVEDKPVSMIVVIEVRSAGRTHEYRTWRSTARRFAIDDAGIAYSGRLGTFTAEYPAFASSRSLDPGEKLTDTLVFDQPVEEARYVDLDLPGMNADVAGAFRFRIPREAWAKK